MNARPLMRLRFTTAPVEEIGLTPHGTLSIFPITGGSFEGERLRGIVLGGADWVTAAADGTRELDLRVTLQTDDSALIHMTFTGVRDDANRYFRTLPRFETAARSTRFSTVCSRWVLGRVTETGRFIRSRRFSEVLQ